MASIAWNEAKAVPGDWCVMEVWPMAWRLIEAWPVS